ncbi:type IV pilus twitching motility protein PilT [Pseudobacteriovorax antillogorgiicola]|uniref:Pilus retraction protein PilT n=1 Tax=Pseudobacteriovorax antillogorgiicola TaxID=1513793 RepID=A0A1Y6BYT6_9BACT|nr:type IV pilus twitching motility protein PilT [Pseudobacteriovorax antillogorgiicola]TCS50212.1 pilus retraction protein PilT [Pseudobacteriovorax antillogorgiicola]SMF32436.1 pilus retraction protein PilT [Pseudobacteriovorax antillogorgiicola]
MENFKKALKVAITEEVEGIRFDANQPPVLIQFANEKPLPELGVLEDSVVDEIVRSLIPDSSSQPGEPTKGELSIVNFGELKLIGCTGEQPVLYVFIPPQGNQLYVQTWNQLTEEPQETPEPPSLSEGVDVSGMFSISSIHDEEPSTGEDSQNEISAEHSIPSLSHEMASDPSPEESFESSATTQHRDNPFQGVALSSAPDDESEDQNTAQSDLASLGFSQDAVSDLPDHTHTNTSASPRKTVFSEQPPPMAGLGQTTMVPPEESPLPTVAQTYQPEPSPESARLSSMPSAHEPNTEESSATIHFGATLPDEMIDPNQRNPIDEILRVMVSQNASDMHLTQNEPICFRVDGEILRINQDPIDTATMESLLLPIMPPKNRREFAAISDTDFAYAVPGLARFRVNIFRDLQGVGAVLRQIPDTVLTADQLGLPESIRKLCYLSKGLVVVTGPTGSGKSTTLAAMIDLINETRKEHILTIEDPVEFVHKQKQCLVNQREVHKHTESFSRALRAALREDPDIILIGEMRDLETVAIAIETAETGHLVFGTLHTNTAISTVDRLVDQFPADQQEQIRVMLAESLKGVVAQTLVKKIGGGRCAAQEILIVDRAVSSLIREGNTHMMQNHMQTQKSKGNILLNEALLKLVLEGKVSAQDAWMKAVDKDAFANLAQSKGVSLEKAS